MAALCPQAKPKLLSWALKVLDLAQHSAPSPRVPHLHSTVIVFLDSSLTVLLTQRSFPWVCAFSCRLSPLLHLWGPAHPSWPGSLVVPPSQLRRGVRALPQHKTRPFVGFQDGTLSLSAPNQILCFKSQRLHQDSGGTLTFPTIFFKLLPNHLK